MKPEDVQSALTQSIGHRGRIIFADGVVQLVDIASVDSEGFMHSGPDGQEPNVYWTRFNSVKSVERIAED